MQESALKFTEVIIADVERQIGSKMVQNFLERTKLMSQVSKFNKDKERDIIWIEFRTEQAAADFIEEHNHRTKIMARTFNIYYSFFQQAQEEKQSLKVVRFQVNGITEDKLRNAYDVCKAYGPCRFKLKYENNKLNYYLLIEFINLQTTVQFQKIREEFQLLELKIRPEQKFGDPNKFRCSIELSNFQPIKELTLEKEDEINLRKKLQQLISKITELKIEAVQLHSFLHKEQPQIKAYFKFSTVELTFSQFQKIRKVFLEREEIECKIFYFQKDSNSFFTLFSFGLINQQELPQKLFQNALIQAFRVVNSNVVQVLVKKQQNSYTAKIYMKDQESGKDLLFRYSKHRETLYKFYKPNSIITIDMFQTNTQQKKQEKLENNAKKIITHINQAKKQEREANFNSSITPLYNYSYQQREVKDKAIFNNYKKSGKYIAKQEDSSPPVKRSNQKFKEKPELREDDFPSL